MTPSSSGPSDSIRTVSVEALIFEAELSLTGAMWLPPSVEELALELPDYEVLQFVERGGMGAVYEARQKRLKRRVAVKILPMELSGDPERAERFVHEATLAANLLHPNIVTVYDSGITPEGLLFYAMEFVSGGTLEEIVKKAPLPPAEAMQWLSPVAGALAFAHAQGVVHHDLKPANILIGPDNVPKVADFGLAQVVSLEGSSGSEGLGSADYSAPEQAEGQVPSHPRADLFSLAVIARELLTGAPRSDDRAPSEIVPGLDERFDAPLLRAMRLRPEDRHASVVEFWEEMNAALAGAERDARARLALARSRKLAWAFGAISAVAVTGMILAVHQASRVHDRERDLSQKEASARRETAENSHRVAQFYVEKTQGHYRKALAHLARAMKVDPGYRYAGIFSASIIGDRPWPVPAGPTLQHGASVTSASYDPSGERILTTSLDGTAQLWRSADGTRLGPPMPHHGAVVHGAFSADGAMAVTGCDDGTVNLWNAATGQPMGRRIDTPGRIVSFDLSADGRRIATLTATGGRSGVAQIWDVATGKAVTPAIPHSGMVRQVRFSPDGKFFATAQRFGNLTPGQPALHLFDSASGDPVEGFRPPEFTDALVVSFAKAAPLIATADRLSAYILSMPDGGVQGKIPSGNSTTMQFLNDDAMLAVGGEAGKLRVDDGRGNRVDRPLINHDQRITCLDISADGELLASGSLENLVRLAFVREPGEATIPILHAAMITDVAIHPRERRILTASADGTARQWLFGAAPHVVARIQHGKSLEDLSLSRDGTTVVVGGRDEPTLAYAVATQQRIGQPIEGAANARTLDCGSGDRVLVCTVDGRVVLGHWRTGLIERDFSNSSHSPARCARLSPDESSIVVGHENGGIVEIDIGTGAARPALLHSGGMAVRTLKFDPTGRWLASGGDDGHVRVWDWKRRVIEGTVVRHDGEIHDIAFSADGSMLATAADDNTTRLRKVGTDVPAADPVRGTSAATAVAFTPHSDGLTLGDATGHVRLRHALLSFPYTMSESLGGTVRRMAWAGDLLVCATSRGTITFLNPGPDPQGVPVPSWWPRFCEEVAGVVIDEEGHQRWGTQNPQTVVDGLSAEELAAPYGRIARRWLQSAPLQR